MAKVRFPRTALTRGIRANLLTRTSKTQAFLLVKGFDVANEAKKRLGANPRRIDTGLLRASITVRRIESRPYGARVGTGVEYALFVHNGTSKMQANPFLRDALRKVFGG